MKKLKVCFLVWLCFVIPYPISAKEQDVDSYVFSQSIDPNKPMIALTFDDGPYPKVTERIVNALLENHSKATFFQLGSRMEEHEDFVLYMAQKGMQIGNHTYTHVIPNNHNTMTCLSELHKTTDLMNKIMGMQEYVVRTPGGAYNDALLAAINGPIILWSIDTNDWKYQNADKIVYQILDEVEDGDIILMHDLYETTAEAVEMVIPELIKRGYQLVTVDELFYYKGISLNAHELYRHA